MALSMVVGFYYHGYYMPFVWPTVIAIVLGAVSMFVGRDAGSSMGRKDGYLVVTLVWLRRSLTIAIYSQEVSSFGAV